MTVMRCNATQALTQMQIVMNNVHPTYKYEHSYIDTWTNLLLKMQIPLLLVQGNRPINLACREIKNSIVIIVDDNHHIVFIFGHTFKCVKCLGPAPLIWPLVSLLP